MAGLNSFLMVSVHLLILPVFTIGSPVGVPKIQKQALKGDDVKLPCVVNSATGSTVVWMDELENVLYFNSKRIIDDERFTLTPFKNNRDLVIRNVTPSDEGSYRCVVNTQPVKLKYYQLNVYVSPKINTSYSSPHVEVSEGTTVSLECNATGYPEPVISWYYRKAGQPPNSRKKVNNGTGRVLQVHNVTRYLDEIYTCVANNGYGDPDDHNIRVRTRFKPDVQIPQTKISRVKGSSVTLSCSSSGYQRPRMYFAKNSFEIVGDDSKHKYTRENVDSYHVKITLKISNLVKEDFGYYKCVAINSMGRVERFIEVKETKLFMRTRKPITKAPTIASKNGGVTASGQPRPEPTDRLIDKGRADQSKGNKASTAVPVSAAAHLLLALLSCLSTG